MTFALHRANESVFDVPKVDAGTLVARCMEITDDELRFIGLFIRGKYECFFYYRFGNGFTTTLEPDAIQREVVIALNESARSNYA